MERNRYYEILEETQKGDLGIMEWLLWFLDCLTGALRATDHALARVLTKAKFWERHRAVVLNERQRLMINQLFDGFEGKLTSSKWAKIGKCSADTALRDIQDLVHKGMLKKEAAGGRKTRYELNLDESR